jgi:cytochrome c-type protein NapC
VTSSLSPLAQFALVCGVLSTVILVGYLVGRPTLTGATRLWLLLGLGIFPLGVAFAGNVAGYEATKTRTFCGSCHVMGSHVSDSNDARSMSLASRHGRNRLFGDENCYVCHADYGMYGTITTKLGGLRHVWMYYTEYKDIPLAEATKTIHLYKPYLNDNCMQCHSTKLDVWNKVADHAASLDDVRTGKVSCASGGCHGFAHPFSKPADKTAGEKKR